MAHDTDYLRDMAAVGVLLTPDEVRAIELEDEYQARFDDHSERWASEREDMRRFAESERAAEEAEERAYAEWAREHPLEHERERLRWGVRAELIVRGAPVPVRDDDIPF